VTKKRVSWDWDTWSGSSFLDLEVAETFSSGGDFWFWLERILRRDDELFDLDLDGSSGLNPSILSMACSFPEPRPSETKLFFPDKILGFSFDASLTFFADASRSVVDFFGNASSPLAECFAGLDSSRLSSADVGLSRPGSAEYTSAAWIKFEELLLLSSKPSDLNSSFFFIFCLFLFSGDDIPAFTLGLASDAVGGGNRDLLAVDGVRTNFLGDRRGVIPYNTFSYFIF
jgi:hypothetical protein